MDFIFVFFFSSGFFVSVQYKVNNYLLLHFSLSSSESVRLQWSIDLKREWISEKKNYNLYSMSFLQPILQPILRPCLLLESKLTSLEWYRTCATLWTVQFSYYNYWIRCLLENLLTNVSKSISRDTN